MISWARGLGLPSLLVGAILVAAVALPSLPAGSLAGEGKETAIKLDVTVEYLDNGLKVILLEDHSVPVISYQTFFRVGARNERPGITGISPVSRCRPRGSSRC